MVRAIELRLTRRRNLENRGRRHTQVTHYPLMRGEGEGIEGEEPQGKWVLGRKGVVRRKYKRDVTMPRDLVRLCPPDQEQPLQ